MRFLRTAWKILVGIKDLLVLVSLLAVLGLVASTYSSRPKQAIGEGALLLRLNGEIVEQPNPIDALESLGQRAEAHAFRLRDLVRSLEAAVSDAQVKAVVLELDEFLGGGQAALEAVGAAMDKVRASGKPVLVYATGYDDPSYQLASHASEIWLHPMGLVAFSGPGGSRLYFKGLIDKLEISAHVYRVGQFKAAVEPFMRANQSPEARRAEEALTSSLWTSWQREVAAARPKAKLAGFMGEPAASDQDLAKAALAAGLVDKLGDRGEFGERVAGLVGTEKQKPAGWFKRIPLGAWVTAHPLPTSADIGIITVAGVISDGESKAGLAGGATIARLIRKGIAERSLKALVVRIDSPGGSALASEEIRSALVQAKRKGLPIVVSMGSVAASGGYWITTPADAIFASPTTITGSIGVFGVLPTFEHALAKLGVTSDGVKTTPLSGQPDYVGGTTPPFDRLMQTDVERTYRRFVSLVAEARHLPSARVEEIAQGRVWDGKTAHELGLVDQFGSLADAIAEAARRAGLDPKTAQAVQLEPRRGFWQQLFTDWNEPDRDRDDGQGRGDLLTQLAHRNQLRLAAAFGEVGELAQGSVIQARCLECGPSSLLR